MERLSCSQKIFAKLALIGKRPNSRQALTKTPPASDFCSNVSLLTDSTLDWD
jgi:hypothetical protein